MKQLEKFIVFGILISLILKFFLIAGGSLIFTLSITILACLYFPLGIAFFNEIKLKDISFSNVIKINPILRIFESIFVGLGLGIICIGILFKLQDWPGSQLDIAFGLIVILIFFLYSVIKYLKKEMPFINEFLKGYSSLAVLVYLFICCPF